MNRKDDALIESKALRESVINRVDVLDKVKNLSMLPNDVYSTIELVADYYEVGDEAVRKIIKVHRDELLLDGMRLMQNKELKSLKDQSVISKNVPSLTVLPRRAILRVGMLLRDSEIAKAVRTHLIEVEEAVRVKAPEIIDEAIVKQKIKEIELKELRAETAKKNAAIREAKLMMEFTKTYKDKLSPESVTAMLNAATTVLTGMPLLPQPQIDKTYTAEQIGGELGISANMVGKIANKYNLKTADYGYSIIGKAKHSSKQFPQWVYNEAGRQAVISAVREEASGQ